MSEKFRTFIFFSISVKFQVSTKWILLNNCYQTLSRFCSPLALQSEQQKDFEKTSRMSALGKICHW